MKKLISIPTLIFAMLFTIVSCKSDSDNESSKTVVGTWQPISSKIYGSSNGTSFSQNYTANDCQKKSRVKLGADLNGNFEYWNDSNGTCTMDANTNFTYTFDSNSEVLYITTAASMETVPLMELTPTKIVYTTNATYDLNDQNVPAKMDVTAIRIN